MIVFLRVFSVVLLVIGAIGSWQIAREFDDLGLGVSFGSSLGLSYFVWLLVVILPLLAFASVLQRLDALTQAVGDLSRAPRESATARAPQGRVGLPSEVEATLVRCPKCSRELKNVTPGQVCYFCGARL